MKYLIVNIFILASTLLFGQNPTQGEPNDSIYIFSFQSELSITLDKNRIYLQKVRVNNKSAEKLRYGDTSFVYDNLFEKVDTVLSNDSRYNDLRSKTYYWSFNDNVSKTKEANPYNEKGTHWMCIEIWRTNHNYKRKLIERCFYRVIGKTEYIMKEEFREYFSEIRSLGDYLEN